MFTYKTISAVFLVLLLNLGRATGEHYRLKDAFIGQDFFSGGWTWETFQDPTHGRVNYVDQGTAIARNLSYVDNYKFFMRADSNSFVAPGSRGRDSVRIKSNAAYDAALMVLELSHMPAGCATWPAWWTLSERGPWPNGGEIDIIEGVNLNSRNAATLHTSADCAMAGPRTQKGDSTSDNCDVVMNSNQGCGTRFSGENSFGENFNRQNGGWFVMQRDRVFGIKIWFWSRNDPSVPKSVQYGSSSVVIDEGWGLPEASFTYDNCDCASHFDAHQIIFDLTFCGDWAGSTFAGSGCGATSCDDYVDQHPDRFREAYWAIDGLRVYIPEEAGGSGHRHAFDFLKRLPV